jgi:hypothetical protein
MNIVFAAVMLLLGAFGIATLGEKRRRHEEGE